MRTLATVLCSVIRQSEKFPSQNETSYSEKYAVTHTHDSRIRRVLGQLLPHMEDLQYFRIQIW